MPPKKSAAQTDVPEAPKKVKAPHLSFLELLIVKKAYHEVSVNRQIV